MNPEDDDYLYDGKHYEDYNDPDAFPRKRKKLSDNPWDYDGEEDAS